LKLFPLNSHGQFDIADPERPGSSPGNTLRTKRSNSFQFENKVRSYSNVCIDYQ